MSFLLKSSDQSPMAAAIRRAIGATAFEDVEVQTPTFNRPPDWTPAMVPPPIEDRTAWKQFERMNRDDLRAWGCRPFCAFTTKPNPDDHKLRGVNQWFWSVERDENASHELWLFPAEWYDTIPNGCPITDINGCVELFERGVTDDDRRYGLLAYGVMIPLAAAASPQENS